MKPITTKKETPIVHDGDPEVGIDESWSWGNYYDTSIPQGQLWHIYSQMFWDSKFHKKIDLVSTKQVK